VVSLKILIVEDDVESGQALMSLLSDMGHHAKWVHAPELALAVCREFRPQLAVLDI
jgi:DNA-binding response OmpR family regulator